MNIKIFDVYNIRARLSVYIIIISPVILTLYAMYEPVRSFSFSVVFIAILCAFSNYLFALQRYIQKDKIYGNTTAKYLYLEDGHINACTKKRYYRKLSLMDEGFSIFDTPTNSNEFKEACASAIQWLRNNTRENRLVQEENMLWGFYKNYFFYYCHNYSYNNFVTHKYERIFLFFIKYGGTYNRYILCVILDFGS